MEFGISNVIFLKTGWSITADNSFHNPKDFSSLENMALEKENE
jgi:hypothetical protein